MNKAQRIQIAQALIRIAPEVTAKDRHACIKKLQVSKVTLSYYLSGKVTNNDKALEVLEFLKNKITIRQQEIQQLCKNK
jgi:hypothetical protein